MFGWNRLFKDVEAVTGMINPTEEQVAQGAFEYLNRFAKTNFIAGSLFTAAGAVAGMLGIEAVKKIKEKKKNKELEDTDK